MDGIRLVGRFVLLVERGRKLFSQDSIDRKEFCGVDGVDARWQVGSGDGALRLVQGSAIQILCQGGSYLQYDTLGMQMFASKSAKTIAEIGIAVEVRGDGIVLMLQAERQDAVQGKDAHRAMVMAVPHSIIKLRMVRTQ